MRFNEVLWPNEYLLTAVGLWPINSNANLSVHLFAYARTVVGICCVTGLLVPHIVTVAVNWGNIQILGEYGALIVPYFMLVLKMLYLALHRRSFASLYHCIKDFWDANVDSKERQHYERLANIGKLTTIICFLSGVADLICFEAIAVTYLMTNHQEINNSISHRPLPMELYYGFDTQPTPTYELIFISQTICMIFIICGMIGCDCTIMVFVVHVSARFRQLAMRFVTSVGWEIKDRIYGEPELRDEFQQFVTQHQHVIRVTNEMNELLSPMVFGQIMSSGLEICLSGYAVIEGETSGLELFKFLVLFISLLFQLGVWCVPAELLIQESTGVADIIYFEVPWYKLSPSQRRDLGFVIMRAQKDCHVSALYKVMCVMRLTEVFNAAGSYMALLRSMKK